MIKEDMLLIVIDYQEKIIPVMYEKEQLIENSRKLIQGFKILGIDTMYTQQYTKGLGMTIDELKLYDNFEFMDKLHFSCYSDENIRHKIHDMDKEIIVICGIEAHICVLQTALDLLNDGYEVYIVEDCVSSRKKNDKDIALRRAESEGIVITTYESILFECLDKAGGSEFKEISALIK